MTRQTAYQILTRYVTNPVLLQHSLYAEAVMRSLAIKLQGDTEEWGITGLLHDADYEKAKGHPERHGLLLFELEPNSIPTTVEHAIKAHNAEYTHAVAQNYLDWALICCDELTGIIAELAQKQKEKKLANLTADTVLQKLNEKNSYKQIKESIFLCEQKLGIPLPEFVGITLVAMQQVESQTPAK